MNKEIVEQASQLLADCDSMLAEWEAADIASAPQALSTEALDALVRDMVIAKDKYESAKDVSNSAEEDYRNSRERVLRALETAKKSKYHVDGFGTVQRIVTYKVTTPKDLEAKRAMLEYFKAKGEEIYLSYVGVNYQSLNSFYNQEAERAAGKGETFSMPGVEAPTSEDNIRFTKERKK